MPRYRFGVPAGSRIGILPATRSADHSRMTSLAHAAGLRSLASSSRPALQLVTNDRPREELGSATETGTGRSFLRLVPSRQTQTVLVADAEAEVLELISFHLGASFNVLRAADGEEALRMALVCR